MDTTMNAMTMMNGADAMGMERGGDGGNDSSMGLPLLGGDEIFSMDALGGDVRGAAGGYPYNSGVISGIAPDSFNGSNSGVSSSSPPKASTKHDETPQAGGSRIDDILDDLGLDSTNFLGSSWAVMESSMDAPPLGDDMRGAAGGYPYNSGVISGIAPDSFNGSNSGVSSSSPPKASAKYDETPQAGDFRIENEYPRAQDKDTRSGKRVRTNSLDEWEREVENSESNNFSSPSNGPRHLFGSSAIPEDDFGASKGDVSWNSFEHRSDEQKKFLIDTQKPTDAYSHCDEMKEVAYHNNFNKFKEREARSYDYKEKYKFRYYIKQDNYYNNGQSPGSSSDGEPDQGKTKKMKIDKDDKMDTQQPKGDRNSGLDFLCADHRKPTKKYLAKEIRKKVAKCSSCLANMKTCKLEGCGCGGKGEGRVVEIGRKRYHFHGGLCTEFTKKGGVWCLE